MAKISVAKAADIPPGSGSVVAAADKTVALFNLDGKFYALDNSCTHVGGPLGEGEVEGNVVICPWHGSRFDITTGAVLGPPARRPVATYPVEVQNGTVYVNVS